MDGPGQGVNAEEEDLTGVQWHDKLWLTTFPLNAATALDYFCLSQFYNQNCNNELIKMQRLDPALLSTMKGVEYGLEPSKPDARVFVITKRWRNISPPSLKTLATYYIIDGVVYQAPCAQVVLANRTTQALHYLRKAFSAVQGATRFTPHGTHVWEPPPKAGNASDQVDRAVTSGEHAAINAVLFDVMNKNKQIHETRAKMEAAAAQPFVPDGGGGAGM